MWTDDPIFQPQRPESDVEIAPGIYERKLTAEQVDQLARDTAPKEPLLQPTQLVAKPCKPRHRHNHEHLSVLARSVSGRQYLAEMMDYTNRKLVANDIAEGQIYNAIAVFAWNPVQAWVTDISEEIARDILNRHGLTRSAIDFIEDYLGVQKPLGEL